MEAFSWESPKADYKRKGGEFDCYHGPKAYQVGAYIYTRAEFEAKFEVIGAGTSRGVHPVLRGELTIAGHVGPMWGGVWDGMPIMRYETQADYNMLSR